jgi:hypothetical protein
MGEWCRRKADLAELHKEVKKLVLEETERLNVIL